MGSQSFIIDDLSREPPLATIGTRWQLFTDRVMGGISNGSMVREMVAGRPAIRMRGDVSLENNGGLVQIALDLPPGGDAFDATAKSSAPLHSGGPSSSASKTSSLIEPRSRSIFGAYGVSAWSRLAARFRLILWLADCAIWPDAPNG